MENYKDGENFLKLSETWSIVDYFMDTTSPFDNWILDNKDRHVYKGISTLHPDCFKTFPFSLLPFYNPTFYDLIPPGYSKLLRDTYPL